MTTLRAFREADLDTLFAQRSDPEAMRLAGTPDDPYDRKTFVSRMRRWSKQRGITLRTIEDDGAIVGTIMSWEHFGEREVELWIGRDHWGRGIATDALAQFLELEQGRPLFATVAKDNSRARRVFDKFGFRVAQTGTSFGEIRGEPVEELLLVLD